jgi:hypothetical protein
MSSDTITLIVVLAFGVIVGMRLEKEFAKQRRAEWRKKKGWDKKGDIATGPLAAKLGLAPEKKVPDAADQLRTVMKADFKAQPLLNKSEARLFKAMDKMVLGMRPDWQVMAQVSLGEILQTPDKDAYACINAKRVDLLIVDEGVPNAHASKNRAERTTRGPPTPPPDADKKSAYARRDWLCRGVARCTPAELRAAGFVVERLVQRELGGGSLVTLPLPVIEKDARDLPKVSQMFRVHP